MRGCCVCFMHRLSYCTRGTHLDRRARCVLLGRIPKHAVSCFNVYYTVTVELPHGGCARDLYTPNCTPYGGNHLLDLLLLESLVRP